MREMMHYNNFKNFIFKLDPESAHHLVSATLGAISTYAPIILKKVSQTYCIQDSRLSQDIFNVTFTNPVGLAAGFDKNATMLDGLAATGFGFIEFGTITPLPQDGNAKPRIFRFPEYNSIQNAMGFNNDGLVAVQKRIKDVYPYKIPLGANIGKNKTTTPLNTLDDYKKLIRAFCEISDYIVINISSPNTPGLRDLQNESFISELFTMAVKMTDTPILLKIAPDLEEQEAIDMCQIALDNGAKGIIATNTTIDYSLLPNAKDFGGISGEVLREKSFKLFQALAKVFYGKTTLISVGGIDSGDEAYRRLKAGASLVQVYSAIIFEGPSLVQNINTRILELMQQEGYKDISELIGADLS
jgi:dihydroorotate dehydrogenase